MYIILGVCDNKRLSIHIGRSQEGPQGRPSSPTRIFKEVGFINNDRSFFTLLGLIFESPTDDKISSSIETNMESPLSLEQGLMIPSIETPV
mmetsp:Transcript_429/g.1281  ORF Transcript_429/g.1281 Transcript_429/m.1281 type:complete len:91 (+) Transcript_429:112-384(+)